MRLFDTHCHFETADENEIAAILERARAAGVEKLLAVGGSDALNEAAVKATTVPPQALRGGAIQVSYALGYDRDQIGVETPPVRTLGGTENMVAVGEIGLDYHYSSETRLSQLKLFASQLEEARERKLPVVIHTREAEEDTVGLLREIPSRGIIHCFTGTRTEAKKYLDLGFYISISGIVTFKAADNVRETARYLPNDRILIETDSPYLAPVPKRGIANEPAFLVHTCEALAKLRGMDAETFAELTFVNGEEALK